MFHYTHDMEILAVKYRIDLILRIGIRKNDFPNHILLPVTCNRT